MTSYSNLAQKPQDWFWGFDNEINCYTDFLFARPSFIEGLSRVLDIGDTLNYYNYSDTPEDADSLALWADWCAVGNDLRQAMSIKVKEHLNEKGNGGRESG